MESMDPISIIFNISSNQSCSLGEIQITLYYHKWCFFSGNCGYAELSTPGNDSVPMVETLGDTDLPVQGITFTFRCPPGRALVGPNSTTCTETGEWEPDPSEAVCTGKSGTVKHFKLSSSIIIM